MIAEGLLEAIREQCAELAGDLTGNTSSRVTTSIGIAFFDEPGLVGADVMINADLTMFGAKEAGGDRYAVHQPDAYIAAPDAGVWRRRPRSGAPVD